MSLFRQFITRCVLLLLTAVAFIGCDVLHDDLSKCNLYLNFKYDYNIPGEDWFAEQVEEVNIFVFNEDGFIKSITESGEALRTPNYRMAIPQSLKNCTVVVWAGHTAEHYKIPTLEVGDPIEKLTLDLVSNDAISNAHIAPLWHSGPEKLTFQENGGNTQTISLVRDTNDITISILSANGEIQNSDKFNISLVGDNGSYNYRNEFLPNATSITYTPAEYVATKSMVYTLRFVKGTPMLLTVLEKDSEQPILANGLPQIDLTEFILKSKPEGFSDQEYLDKRYLWDIQLAYDAESFLAISLTINDWVHWFQKTEL